MPTPQPLLGRVVAYATPTGPKAAIITEVLPLDPERDQTGIATVSLSIFYPGQHGAVYDEYVLYSADKEPGTWSWVGVGA